MHIAGEGGDDDALIGCTLKELSKLSPTIRSLGVEPGFFGIGAIAEEGQNALAAQFAKADQVDGFAGDGGEVHLEIAGVDDEPRRVRMAKAQASGMEWLTRTNSTLMVVPAGMVSPGLTVFSLH